MRSTLERALANRVEALREMQLAPVNVAVLDSGVDATHPDLTSRVRRAFGVVIDAAAANQVAETTVPKNNDTYGHGTAVGSIIASIAPNAALFDYRILGADNSGAGDALLTSLKHALDAGHRIINMSLAATPQFAARLLPLCDRAYRNGQVIVAAKRNMPLADMGYPAEIATVISVDRGKFETNLALRYAPNSVIEFVGHGEEVVVAAPGGGYTTKNGTSFATPAVTGLVALVLGAFPDLRPFEVKSLLRSWSLE